MKYYVVADEFTVLGFSLAGVEGAIVSDEDETRAAYQMAVENPDVGVLIITERYADLIRPLVDELLFADRPAFAFFGANVWVGALVMVLAATGGLP